MSIAFSQNESSSILLLGRSKQVLNSMITAIIRKFQNVKIIRVNNTLLQANENKIMMKFAESLGLQAKNREPNTVEMINEV